MLTGSWFACEQPERPPDAMVVWHYGGECDRYTFKAMVQATRYPDDTHVAWLNEQMEGPISC